MKNKFKVALIGCGVISDNHLIPLISNPSVELVGLCDINRERAEQKLIKHGLSIPVYTDYIEMLDSLELDSIHIATPHYLHCEMTLEALKRNVNVFLEKPMCISEDEIEKMLAAERESLAKVCVCFQNRLNPSTIFAKQICEKDGGAISAYGSLFWHRDDAYYAQDAWRGKMKTEGGGVMINQAIHTIDLLHIIMGKPISVTATKSNHSLKGTIDVEDSCEGLILFEGGGQANFYATNSYRGLDNNYVYIVTKNHKIEIRRDHIYLDDVRIDDENGEIPLMGKAVYGIGHRELINRFYEAIKNRSEMPVSLESAQWAVRIILAAYKSNDTPIKI